MEKNINSNDNINFIQTVNGPVNKNFFGVTDAHTHIWSKEYPSKFNSYSIPELEDYYLIFNELSDFKKNFKGSSLVDCTPYECGRDGNKLNEFSLKTGVNIVSVTGFHKRQYYPPGSEIWSMDINKAQKFFTSEFYSCLKETNGDDFKIKAGVIKIPFIGNLEDHQLKILTDAAINSSFETNLPIIVHTEGGLNIEFFVDYLKSKKVSPSKVTLCHMDKRNDFILHKDLVKEGFFLEYDTFLREKYKPDENVWPLIQKMVNEGLEDSIMIGSDIYENNMWEKISMSQGYSGFFKNIKEVALAKSISLKALNKIIGENAADFLSIC